MSIPARFLAHGGLVSHNRVVLMDRSPCGLIAVASPSAMKARLNILSGDARPELLDLEPSQAASLGRSRDNSVVLRSEHASRLHAKILFDDGRWQIQDFSLNGTFVNGERVNKMADLSTGQEVRIGEIRMRFSLDDLPTQTSRQATTERRDKSVLSGS